MILADKTDFRSDFRKIQDWVASHIIYTQDSYYYWQTPAETLNKRTGNCKDFAVLLCTICRSSGIPAGDIYVAIGKDRSNRSHAFIIEKWLLGRWQVIEPQVGGFIISDLSALDTADRYAITSRFNDASYIGQAAFITSSETFLIPGSPAAVTGGKSSVPVFPEYSNPATASSLPVNPVPDINYFYFKTSPNIVGQPGSSILTWDVSGASSVYIDRGIGYVSPVGNYIVPPGSGITYTLTAINAYGTTTSMAAR